MLWKYFSDKSNINKSNINLSYIFFQSKPISHLIIYWWSKLQKSFTQKFLNNMFPWIGGIIGLSPHEIEVLNVLLPVFSNVNLSYIFCQVNISHI
jgi:hypothetical protein